MDPTPSSPTLDPRGLRLFALAGSAELGRRVAGHLGAPLASHEEREFEDGEHKTRPLESVRGRDVYVLQSLRGGPGRSVNDELCRLLFFLGALRDAGARRLTAVVPYLCYSRKERRTKARDPVTTRYVACLFEAVGIDRIVTMDVHELASYQNAYRVPAEHLVARPLLVEHLGAALGDAPVCIASPDIGGIKRAERLREDLAARLGREPSSAFLTKHRSEGVLGGGVVVGDVRGRTVILLDDLIASGSTLARAATALREHGAAQVLAAATHGVFSGAASSVLRAAPIGRLIVTDTLPPDRLDAALVAERLTVLDSSKLLAEAIARLHRDESLAELGAP